MEFKLTEFAGEELKHYIVIRQKLFNSLAQERGVKEEQHLVIALIYKASLKQVQRDPSGGTKTGLLSGKIWKTEDLKEEDIIIVENMKYRVVAILPRLYADFNEFTLEYVYEK